MEYSFLAARLSFTFDVHMCVFHLANKLCCCCCCCWRPEITQKLKRDIDELKYEHLESILQGIIDKAIDHWQTRLRACVKAKGHNFKHLLWSNHTAVSFQIRYDSVYLTCGKKLTGSQLSLPHGINRKLKCETKNKMMSVISPVRSRYHEAVQ